MANVPDGIHNQENLYNDVYGDLPPLRWNDPEFQDKLRWIEEETGASITSWYSQVNNSPGVPPLRTSTQFHAELPDGAGGYDFDVRTVAQHVESVSAILRKIKLGVEPAQMRPYPGFAARNPPPTGDPVGERWPDHPWRGRKMYRANPEELYAEGQEFERRDGTYTKRRFVVRPGSGPFGTGGETAFAWERTFSR